MPNFLALPRPDLPSEEVTFEAGGETVTLKLQSLDAYGMMMALEQASEFAAAYRENYFPMPHGGALQVTAQIAQTVGIVCAMQRQPDPYPIAQIFGLLVNLPAAWTLILAAIGRLQADAEPTEGNA
jgi:hypothetical protein